MTIKAESAGQKTIAVNTQNTIQDCSYCGEKAKIPLKLDLRQGTNRSGNISNNHQKYTIYSGTA